MLHTLIIDDEPKARNSLSGMIQMFCPQLEIVGEANNVKNGILAIKEFNPNLIFLDISMPDGTGFDVIKNFSNPNFRVIFVTAFEEFAVKAFKFSAIDYILKPVDPDDLISAVQKVEETIERESLTLKMNALLENIQNNSKDTKKIVLKTRESIHLAVVKEIVRCEADQSYTEIFFENSEKLVVSKPLKELEELLTEYGFFRIHQSHLINKDFIKKIDKASQKFVTMMDGSQIPISSRRNHIIEQIINGLT